MSWIILKIMKLIRLLLNENVCRSVGFLIWESGILFQRISDSACVGSFDPTKEFGILRGVSAHVLATTWHICPRVRLSICLQDQSVCMMVRLTSIDDLLVASLVPFSDYVFANYLTR